MARNLKSDIIPWIKNIKRSHGLRNVIDMKSIGQMEGSYIYIVELLILDPFLNVMLSANDDISLERSKNK